MARITGGWYGAVLAFAVATSACFTTGAAYGGGAGASVSFEYFEDELEPYGEWVDFPGHGWAWRPYPTYAGHGFRPYVTGGHWVYSEYGWVFESDYPFGWATFHYGRWAYDSYWGWVWFPGTEWAPAWVEWRHGDAWVGWAPLPPVGWSITYIDPWWSFVDTRVFVRTDLHLHVVYGPRVSWYYERSRPVRHYVRHGHHRYDAGPRPRDIEIHTRERIRPVPIQPEPMPRYAPSGRVREVPEARVREDSARERDDRAIRVAPAPTRRGRVTPVVPDEPSRTEDAVRPVPSAPRDTRRASPREGERTDEQRAAPVRPAPARPEKGEERVRPVPSFPRGEGSRAEDKRIEEPRPAPIIRPEAARPAPSERPSAEPSRVERVAPPSPRAEPARKEQPSRSNVQRVRPTPRSRKD